MEGNQTCEDRAKPKVAKPSAQVFPSLYTWLAKKFMLLIISKQLDHLFLIFQGTILSSFKASTTNCDLRGLWRHYNVEKLCSKFQDKFQ